MISQSNQHEQTVTHSEIREWLTAFRTDPLRALEQVPNQVYSYLRNHNLLDVNHVCLPVCSDPL